jgi:hypothetical protein
MDDKEPHTIKKNSFQTEMSHAELGVLSNLVAASIEVTAVITSTITIRGLDTSI